MLNLHEILNKYISAIRGCNDVLKNIKNIKLND